MTNLKLGADGKIQFRSISKSNGFITAEKIAKLKKDIEESMKGDPKAGEYSDLYLAKARPSQDLLSLNQYYSDWESETPMKGNPKLHFSVNRQ